jgi:hypothetical protein
MAIAGLVLVGLSGLAMLVFGLQILVRAFKTSLGWGLATLLIPFAGLVFIFKNWALTKRPALGALACVPLYGIGFGLIALGGGMTVTRHASRSSVTAADPTADLPMSPPRVETPSLVLTTLGSSDSVADPSALAPCEDTRIGTTALTPRQAHVCARYTNGFGVTKVTWVPVSRQDQYFGDPMVGQWVTWLRVAKKDSQEQVVFVLLTVMASRNGRLGLECDAGGDNRTQVNATPPFARGPGFQDECETPATAPLGRIQFNWNPKAPRVRFQATEGPIIDLELVPVG